MSPPAVPLTRLDNADPALLQELLSAVDRVARGADFILGDEVESFENEFATYCETSCAIGVSSGTDALALSLRALGVGPGDEVVLPGNSFIATAEAVTLVGAEPRVVDVDPDTHLLTAEIAERALGPRTKCIIPVHLYGRTVDMDPVLALAGRHGLAVVEDACQAHGAMYRGRRVGSLGDCGCFSFYPAKNLGAWGDGGAIVTSNSEIADRVRLLRSHGENPRYRHRVCGATARLDAIQAAVLRIKLTRLDDWNEQRRSAGSALSEGLAGCAIQTPAPAPAGSDHVFHQYVVLSEARDALRNHLQTAGIASAIHYPTPIHRSEAYAGLDMGPGALPVVEDLAGRVCSLPIFPGMSTEEVARVAAALAEFQSPREALAA